MKTLLILLLTITSVFADLSVNVYSGTTAQSPVRRGCTQVTFDMVGYSGVIGNATFSNVTAILPVSVSRDGDLLGAISYTVTGGTLFIVEVR
jgi:hypothetical protein